MTHLPRRGRSCGRADPARPSRPIADALPRRGRAAPPPPSRTRPARRCRRSCAPRWTRPSAPPMPTAPGTGRPPTRPARRRQSCSCANSARRMRARAGVSGRLRCRCWPRSPAFCPPIRAARRRARRFSNSRRRSRSASPPATAAAITPADLVLEPSAGTGLLAILAETRRRRARPQRTRRDPRRAARALFPASPSPASTPRRSTIISTPASPDRRADEPAFLGDGQCRWPHGRRRASPHRLGAGAARRRRPARRHHRRQLRARHSGLARRLRPPAGARPHRVHRRHRRRGLCQARHHHRHAADRHRPLPADDPAVFRHRPASRPMPPRCSAGSRSRFRRGCRSRTPSSTPAIARVQPPRTGRSAIRAAPLRSVAGPVARSGGGRARL